MPLMAVLFHQRTPRMVTSEARICQILVENLHVDGTVVKTAIKRRNY